MWSSANGLVKYRAVFAAHWLWWVVRLAVWYVMVGLARAYLSVEQRSRRRSWTIPFVWIVVLCAIGSVVLRFLAGALRAN